jgi:hypothetical protein
MVSIAGLAIFVVRRTLMELDWSAQSPHIRTLYHPWQPGDGWDEATIEATEARLGLRLPTPLRNFYLAWGRRRDITKTNDPMLDPDELVVRADTLIFWVANQSSWYWGMPRKALEDDPSVVITAVGPSGWEVESKLNWKPSHPRLLSFLDDMTYLHAFYPSGAIHGGYTQLSLPDLPAHHRAWLEKQWNKAAIVSPIVFGIMPDAAYSCPPLYVRDGQAFWWEGGGCLAAREVEVVDEISQRFQIKWDTRW